MFIGIDLGTSSVKIILIDENQTILSSHSSDLKLHNPKSGFYEQNPESWFKATLECLSKIKNDNAKEFASVKSLSISGQMHGATLISNDNDVLHPCILWNDTRSMKQCFDMEKKFPSLRDISGNIAMPGFTAPKILWLKENKTEIFKKINKVLLPKDYLRFRLSGTFYTDMSDASGTLWLNVKERKWSSELLDLSDLSVDNMPELVEGNEPTCIIEKKLSNQLGFDNEVIIAGGAGDQAAGAVGSGVVKTSQSVISLGTSGVYFSPTEKFIPNANKAVHSFCHCIPKTWHHMSVMLSATNCINWASNLFNTNLNDFMNSVEVFYKEDHNHNAPYFFPYLTGERTPYNNPYLRGSFHNLDTSTEKKAIFYSIIEGISFGIKDGYDAVHEVSNKSEKTFLVGGGSKSTFWGKLISSLLNQPILVGEESDYGPALGAARLAMLSTNKYSIDEIIKPMKKINNFEVSKDFSQILNKRYKIWKEIVKSNEPIAKSLIE